MLHAYVFLFSYAVIVALPFRLFRRLRRQSLPPLLLSSLLRLMSAFHDIIADTAFRC
jgi:hypothetical protein